MKVNSYIKLFLVTAIVAVTGLGFLVFGTLEEPPVEQPLGAVDTLIQAERTVQDKCFTDRGKYCDKKVVTKNGVKVTSWPFSGGVKPDKTPINKGYNIVTEQTIDGIIYTKRVYRTDDGYGFEESHENPVPFNPPAVATTT